MKATPAASWVVIGKPEGDEVVAEFADFKQADLHLPPETQLLGSGGRKAAAGLGQESVDGVPGVVGDSMPEELLRDPMVGEVGQVSEQSPAGRVFHLPGLRPSRLVFRRPGGQLELDQIGPGEAGVAAARKRSWRRLAEQLAELANPFQLWTPARFLARILPAFLQPFLPAPFLFLVASCHWRSLQLERIVAPQVTIGSNSTPSGNRLIRSRAGPAIIGRSPRTSKTTCPAFRAVARQRQQFLGRHQRLQAIALMVNISSR